LPNFLDSTYLVVANNSKVVNCKLLAAYSDHHDSLSVGATSQSEHGGVEKVIVIYMLKQLSSDRWLVSGDDELESKSVGFTVSVTTSKSQDSDSRRMVGTLVQKGSDGSLEMVFQLDKRDAANQTRDGSLDIKKALQSIASIPLPPYIEPENAIKVCYSHVASVRIADILTV
jgi:S-adenosylmethionine:tRNA-ribosyltransferase-isomerase (queuine synthetase)